MPVSFLTTPLEIIQKIVLLAGCDNPIGPPRELLALLLTCRMLYYMLSFDTSTALYATIFAQRFDTSAIYRRRSFSPDDAKSELRRRFRALHCFRQLATNCSCVTEALTIALFMIMEDDGLNASQLIWARLPQFINIFLRRNIFDGSNLNHGWPLESLKNTLLINVAWFSTSNLSLQNESEAERKEVMRSLRPFAFAAFRYSPLSPPEIRFDAADIFCGNKSASMSVHGPYPPPFVKPLGLGYLGRPLTLRPSPIAVPALLSYFARLRRIKLSLSSHLPPNRAVADAEGRQGPTKEDIIDFNSHRRIHLQDPSDSLVSGHRTSAFYDNYWSWIVSPYSKGSRLCHRDTPPYVLGGLTGHWRGAAVTPDAMHYRTWLSNIDAPKDFEDPCMRPLYFTLCEHYCYSPTLPVPLDDEENGILNGWLPKGCKMTERDDGIEFYDERGKYRTFYETYRPDAISDSDQMTRYRGVVDVIITGKTDARRGAAWGAYTFLGRVRLSDGATVLVRKPVNPDVTGWGSALMRGVVTNSLNFVGRWRGASTGEMVAELETAFVVCKSDEP